jgi:cytochrome c5
MHSSSYFYFISLLALFCYSSADAADGVSVYEKNCIACHGDGVAGAPKIGDAEAWKERLPKGLEAMVTTVIEGVQGYSGAMPPRGGNPSLSDDQIRSAVQYMVDRLE